MAMNKQRALSAALVVERAVELGVGSARREGGGKGGKGSILSRERINSKSAQWNGKQTIASKTECQVPEGM